MDTALGFGFRNALDSVPATFELQFTKDPVALETQNDFLESTSLGNAGVHDFDFPALVVCMVLVHRVQVPSEQSGFFAAGPGSDFENASSASGIFTTDAHVEKRIPNRLAFRLESIRLFESHIAFVWIRRRQHGG